MSIFKKVSAFLTAVGIACSCAACGYNTINALTVDNVEIPAGIYIYYANSAYNQALSKLSEEYPDLDTTDAKAVKLCTLEGKDVMTWIQDEATDMCAEYVVIEQKFEEMGLELDADTQAMISMMKDYYWTNSQEMFAKNGISESSYEKIVTSSYKSELIFEHMYGVDGTEGTTEQDVYDYFKDHNIRCEYLEMPLRDGEGNLLKSDGKAEIMEMAKDYQKRAEKALASDGIEGVKAEMAAIREDYANYTASLTATEDDENTDVTESETIAETETEAETSAEDTAAEDTAETGVGEVDPESFNEPAPSDEAETETASDADETTDETEDTTEGETEDETTDETEDTTEDETADTTEDETTDEENGGIDLTSEDGAEEETNPYANEIIIPIINEDDYDDPEDIYNKKTYKQLLDIQPKDYGKVYIVEEDETYYLNVPQDHILFEEDTYYLAVRYDIEERMNDEDLWTENAISSTVYSMFTKNYEDLLDEWVASVTISRNDAAYRRYDPFKFDFS